MPKPKIKLPKNFTLIAAAVCLVAIVVLVIALGGSSGTKTASKVTNTQCGPYRTDKVISINGSDFNTEVANTTEQKDKGLSGRPCILPNQAMLFTFSKDGHYAFWMKDMKFPVDVVWITSGHRIAAIERNFAPSTYPERRGNKLPAQYVLELKANRTQELDASIGTIVRL